MKQKTTTEILTHMLIQWDVHRFSVAKYAPTPDSTDAELAWYDTALHTEEVLRRLIGLTYGLTEVSELEAKLTELGLDED